MFYQTNFWISITETAFNIAIGPSREEYGQQRWKRNKEKNIINEGAKTNFYANLFKLYVTIKIYNVTTFKDTSKFAKMCILSPPSRWRDKRISTIKTDYQTMQQ